MPCTTSGCAGVLARPAKPGRRPAVLVAHGLGAAAAPDVAVEIARNLDVGDAGDLGAGPGRLRGDAGDLPGSPAALRHRPGRAGELALRLRVRPHARGDLARRRCPTSTGTWSCPAPAWVASPASSPTAVDDRIAGVLAMSASGGLEAAARRGLVAQGAGGGLEAGSTWRTPAPRAFFRALDPLAFAKTQHGTVYLLSGAQDEFFPMDQVLRTFQALRAPQKSLALMPDYDHGWYFGTGCPARCMPGAPKPASDCPQDCPRTCAGSWPYCGPQDGYNRQDEVNARWALPAVAGGAGGAATLPARRPFPSSPAAPTSSIVMIGMVKRESRAPRHQHQRRLHVRARGAEAAPRRRLPPAAAPPDGAIVIAEVEGPDGAVTSSIPRPPSHFWPPVRPFSPVDHSR